MREVELCSEFIAVDGPADEQQIAAVRSKLPAFCKDLTNQDLVYISSLVDESKQVSEIVLPYVPVLPELPTAEVNWSYGLNHYDHKIVIDPHTLRPLNPDSAK